MINLADNISEDVFSFFYNCLIVYFWQIVRTEVSSSENMQISFYRILETVYTVKEEVINHYFHSSF